jgi:hypothetical protein
LRQSGRRAIITQPSRSWDRKITMKLALITPTYARDRRLLDISCAHVDRYCGGDIEHLIIPSRAEKNIFKHLAGVRRRVIYKEDVFDQFIQHLPFRIRGKEIFLFNYVLPVRGWIVQQLLKFCAPDITDADLFVFLDSDVFPIRRFSATNFLIDRKVRFLRKPSFADIEPHRKWHRSAGRLLGLAEKSYYGADYIGHFISWRSDTCVELRKFLEEKWGTRWLRLLSREADISEYILYGIYVDQILDGDTCRHYMVDAELCLSSWYFDSNKDLISQLIAALRNEHLAVNLQSNLGLPIETYAKFLTSITEKIEEPGLTP